MKKFIKYNNVMLLHSECYFAKTLARLRAAECDGGGQQRHLGLGLGPGPTFRSG